MKINDINTLDDLKVFLEDWCKENPEDDCCELIRSICEKNGWVYTMDSDISYDDDLDWATDGDYILSFTDRWQIFKNEGQDINYNGIDITVREDGDNYYVNFNTGLGEAIYPKADWTLEKAIEDEANVDKKIK